jgi:hypothetical protein
MIHSDFMNKESSRKRYWARSMVRNRDVIMRRSLLCLMRDSSISKNPCYARYDYDHIPPLNSVSGSEHCFLSITIRQYLLSYSARYQTIFIITQHYFHCTTFSKQSMSFYHLLLLIFSSLSSSPNLAVFFFLPASHHHLIFLYFPGIRLVGKILPMLGPMQAIMLWLH